MDAAIRRDLAARLTHLLRDGARLPRTPRPYQHEALAAVRDWLADPGGPARTHICQATGLGKTVLIELAAHASLGMRILIVEPTLALLVQTLRALAPAVGGLIGQVSSLKYVTDIHGEAIAAPGWRHQQIVVTTNASFCARGRDLREGYKPHLIIWDECHTAYASGEQNELARYGETTPILGLTATPDYLIASPQPGLEEVVWENGATFWGSPKGFARTHFGPCIDRRPLRWGIEEGWLAPLAWNYIDFDGGLTGVPIARSPDAGYDYRLTKLQAAMASQWDVLTDRIVGLYASGQGDLASKHVFAACPSIDEAERLADKLIRAGVSAACVSSRMPHHESDRVLRGFNDGDIRFLSSVVILREGWDASIADVCMMLRPTQSLLLYLQYLGRVLRLLMDGRSKIATVYDAFRGSNAIGPLTAAKIFANGPVERGSFLMRPPHLPLVPQPFHAA